MAIGSSIESHSSHSRFLIDNDGNWQFKLPCIHWYYFILFVVAGYSINKLSLSSNQISNIAWYSKSDRPLANIIIHMRKYFVERNGTERNEWWFTHTLWIFLDFWAHTNTVRSYFHFYTDIVSVSIGDQNIHTKMSIWNANITDADWV